MTTELETTETGGPPRPTRLAPGEVRRILVEAGDKLSERSRGDLLVAGSSTVRELVEILVDGTLQKGDGPGGGYAPIHAVALLAELRAAEAVEPMLAVLLATDWQDIIHDELIRGIPRLGALVVEPALQLYAEREDPEERQSLAVILAKLGVRDERIFETIAAEQRRDPDIGSGLFVDYGDPAAIPLLLEAFDRQPVEQAERMFANQVFIEIADAIEELGGELSPAQTDKFARAMRVRDKAFEAVRDQPAENRTPVRTNPKRGRNEPCWCGSGTKYKKCHLLGDEAKES